MTEMSLSQSRIPFNVRKKRISSKTGDVEKGSSNVISIDKNKCSRVNDKERHQIGDSDEENVEETSVIVTSSGRIIKRKSCISSSSNSSESSPPKRIQKSASSAKKKSKTPESSTPNSLMKKLKLNAYSSDEKEIEDEPTKLKPKQLYSCGSKRSDYSTLRAARLALGSAGPVTDNLEERYGPLIGREEQFQQLLSHLHSCIDNDTTLSAYVSGPPGTGKTASLGRIMEDPKIKSNFKCIFLNCTSIRTASSIYSQIGKALNPKATVRGEREWLSEVEEFVTNSKKRILLVLDEMDQLLMGGARSPSQQVLYTVFGWPHLPGSRISLVGVANALDLTSRALPRLHASHPPLLIHFPPYSREEIHKILLSRLSKAGVGEVFSAPALQMLASKVASVSGDLRRALDVGRRVVQLVGDRNSTERASVPPLDMGVLQPTSDHSSNSRSPRKSKGNSVVELQEVLSVLNGVYSTSQSLGSSMSNTTSSGSGLPVQQKFLLCSLILLVNKGPKGKPITIGKLHEVYVRVCKGRNVTPVDQSEFHSLCTLIETRGIIRLIPSKEARLIKVSLRWDEEEVAGALMDQHLLAAILNDVSYLSR